MPHPVASGEASRPAIPRAAVTPAAPAGYVVTPQAVSVPGGQHAPVYAQGPIRIVQPAPVVIAGAAIQPRQQTVLVRPPAQVERKLQTVAAKPPEPTLECLLSGLAEERRLRSALIGEGSAAASLTISG